MRQFTSSALMVIGAAAVIASVNRVKDPESPLSIRSYHLWLGSHTYPESRPGEHHAVVLPSRGCVSSPTRIQLSSPYCRTCMSQNGDSPSERDGDVDAPRNVGIMEFLHSAHSES